MRVCGDEACVMSYLGNNGVVCIDSFAARKNTKGKSSVCIIYLESSKHDLNFYVNLIENDTRQGRISE